MTATINGIARIRVPRIDRPDFCASYTSIDARLVYQGQHVAIFEDVASPLAGGFMAASYSALGAEFDTLVYPLTIQHFGDPLALDSLLDANGRLAIVLSPLVNLMGPAGFVVSCDFYPEAAAPSSNTGEVLYAVVPTVLGAGYASFTPDAWRWIIRSVVMHETKHLAAFAERLARGFDLEDLWLEEGSAVLAEELFARRFSQATWKGNAAYQQTLFCEVRPAAPSCSGRPFAMFNAFALLHDYALAPDRHSPLGPTSSSDATFYGSSWSFLRFAIDHHVSTEGAFLRTVVQDPRTGIGKIQALINRPFSDILPEWLLSLYVDDRRTDVSPALAEPSWNLVDIFGNMATDFPFDFSSQPLPLTSAFGPGERIYDLPGGAAAFLLLDRAEIGQLLLHFRVPDGSPPHPDTRLAILRLR